MCLMRGWFLLASRRQGGFRLPFFAFAAGTDAVCRGFSTHAIYEVGGVREGGGFEGISTKKMRPEEEPFGVRKLLRQTGYSGELLAFRLPG